MRKEEKVINYEREYPRLIAELEKKISETEDYTLLEIYRKQVFDLIARKSRLEFFKLISGEDTLLETYDKDSWSVIEKNENATPSSVSKGNSEIDESAKKEDFDNLFMAANIATFGGFDYYYLEDLNAMMEKRMSDQKRSVNMLINRSQLRKLQSVVDSIDSISFVSYVGENGEDKYAIWQEDTPLFINLIPFTRNEKGRMELDGVLYRNTAKVEDYFGAPYRRLDKKRRV